MRPNPLAFRGPTINQDQCVYEEEKPRPDSPIDQFTPASFRPDLLQANGIVGVDKQGRPTLIPSTDHLRDVENLIVSQDYPQYFLLVHHEEGDESSFELQAFELREHWLGALCDGGMAKLARNLSGITADKEKQMAVLQGLLNGSIRGSSPIPDALY